MRRCLPFFTSDNIDQLSLLVAHQVDEVVGLCRQLGIPLPSAYDVGLKIVEHAAYDGRCEITLRVGEARQAYHARYNVYEPRAFFTTLQQQAEQLALHWMNTNSSCKLDKDASRQLLSRMRSPEWLKLALQRADAQRQKTTFARVR